MASTPPEQQETNAESRAHSKLPTLRSSLLAWEIYPMLLLAGFLRLYRLDTSAFSGDQSTLFLLANNAVRHGLIPATSNGSSILTLHPPAAIYFLMLPALLSSDPLWAVVMTALFNVIAVLITYIFTRRYYGRLAASIAALLFATAGTSIAFSRFIWQPNLLAPLVILYIFALFRGVVERRKGWLFPALLLLGVMYQLHELTLLFVGPLLVAMLLAPRTIRLRDSVLACACLLLLFAPYLLWEASSGFADVHTALSLSRTAAHYDTQALTFYERLLRSYYYDERFLPSSYYDPPRGAFYDPRESAFSAVFKLLTLISWSYRVLVLLLAGGLITAGIIAVRIPAAMAERPGKKLTHTSFLLTCLLGRWSNLRNDPVRSGLFVLLAWQLVAPLVLSRHTAPVHQHYLFLTIPGPFILIGFFITCAQGWIQRRGTALLRQAMRNATYAVTTLLLSSQLLGSTAALIDTVNGVNSHVFGYNGLGSLQHALHEADQVAQQHHFNRVYITISASADSLTGLPFLAAQMRTPATLFDAAHCLVLPAPAAGPGLLLARSSDGLVLSLLKHFATATLIDRPPLQGTSPFQLYSLSPAAGGRPASIGDGFVNDLRRLAPYPQQLRTDTSSFLVTGWTLLHDAQPAPLTSYTYMLNARADSPGAKSLSSECLLTSMRAGDQLLAAFALPQGSTLPPALKLTSQFLVSSAYTMRLGPLHFETAATHGIRRTLHTEDGNDTLTIQSNAQKASVL